MWLGSLCLFVIFITSGNSMAVQKAMPVQKPAEPVEVYLENFSEQCAKGPQVWCQNPLTAKQCNAVNHCIQTVWETHELEADSSSYCESCINFVENSKDFFSKNVTVEQEKVVLETLCKISPAIISVECVYVVDKTLPELQKYIETVSPHSFCATLMLCNSRLNENYLTYRGVQMKSVLEATTTPATAISTVPTNDLDNIDLTCDDCHSLYTTGKYMYDDAKQDDVLNTMLRLCGQLSSFSDFCSAVIQSNFQQIHTGIKSATVRDFCHYVPDCRRMHSEVYALELMKAEKDAPKQPNDQTCDFCVAIVKHLRDIVIANTTKDEFKTVLEGLCHQLGTYKEECSQMVDQYYELAYDFLVEELNGKEICEEINICPKATKFVATAKTEGPIIGLDEAKAIEMTKNTDKPDLHRVKLTDGHEKHNLLGSNRCTWGPSYWCTNMRTTKECSVPLKHCIGSWEKLKLAEDNGEICKVCKDMVQQARDQLNSNETQEELKDVFEGSCKLIPVKIARHECIKVVDEFVPELVEALSSQMNPQIVCATAGLCNNAKMDLLYEQGMKQETEEKKAVDLKVVDLPIERMFPAIPVTALYGNSEAVNRAKEACELCELFLHFVQQQITLPASEKEIKTVVDQVCLKMKSPIATQCSKFVEEYGDNFIALLAQRIDPSQVCPSIGACLQMIDNVKPTCPLCLLAVESLENAVVNNKTEENIKSELDKLCSHLGKEMKSDCERFVNTFSERLVDAVMADFSKNEICTYLKLCSAEVMTDVETIVPPKSTVKSEVTDAAITTAKTEAVNPVTTEVVNAVTTKHIETNEVSENITGINNKQQCALCEFVMTKLDQELKDKKTEDEIKHAIHVVCSHMPHTVVDQCNNFINQYADLILNLLADSMEPKQICSQIGLCKNVSEIQEVEHVSTSEQHKTEEEEDTSTMIVYSCLGIVGVISCIVLGATALKSRNNFIHNTPYIRVTK